MIQNLQNAVRMLVVSLFCIVSINAFGVLNQYNVQRLQLYTSGNHPTSIYWQDMYSATYNSGRVLPTWNYTATTYTDNNLSTPQALPFTFNYDGINNNYFYISTNGFIVLDTLSSATLASKQLPMYASNANRGRNAGTASADTAYNGSYLSFVHSPNPVSPYSNNKSYSARTIAPFYTDLVPGTVNSTPSTLAADICWYYSPGNITTGDTMVIIEWRQLKLVAWTGDYRRCWFQARLHKTTGIIEFYYFWNANQYTTAYPQNYLCGLNSATWAAAPTYANNFMQSTANSTTFAASSTASALSAPEAQKYKLVFTKVVATADLTVSNISPPISDTCGYSSSQIIVDSIHNTGSTLTFDATHILKVYSQITDSVNGAQVWTALDSGTYTSTFTTNTTIGVQMLHTWNFSAGGQYTIRTYLKDSVYCNPTTLIDGNLLDNSTTVTIYNSKVTASSDVSTMCSGVYTYLHASPTINHAVDSLYYTHYTKMTYSAPAVPTHQITSWTGGSNDGTAYVALPFTFHFFGYNRSALYVCTNGFVEFECAYTTPSTSLPDNNAICPSALDCIGVAWSDMRLDLGGSIYWDTVGTTPNREFILRYNRVYDSTNATAVSAYMILHETTNLIEFQNDTIPSGSYTQGIQDSLGVNAYALSSRNFNTWSATHDAYLFSSQPTYYWTASPTDASLTSTEACKQNPYVSPTVTTIYTVTMNGGNTGYPDSIGICPKTSTVTVTVTAGLGAIGAISGPATVCAYTNVTYIVPTVTNATSYIWDYSGLTGCTFLSQHTDTINLTLGGSPGGYIRVRAYMSSCGTYTAWAQLYVTIVDNVYGAGQWVGGISTDWFTVLNWCGGLPTSTIDANIDNTYYTSTYFPVIYSSGAVCKDLRMGGVNEALTINTGYNLDVYGSWWNGWNGYSATVTANSGSTVTFKGTSSLEYIDGYIPTTFANIIINRGSDTTSVIENIYGNSPPSTMNMTGNLTITNGLFRVSETTSSVQYTASTTMTIPSTGGLELNGGNLVSGNYSITNNGLFRMTSLAADDTLGTTAGNSITNSGAGSLMDIQGGKLTVASQIIVKSGATFKFDDMNTNNYINNGGQQDTIVLNKQGTTNNTQALFEVDATSKMYITDGYFIFHNPNSGTGYDLRFSNGSGTKFLDANNSSTFQFGEASTTSASAIFKMVDTAGLVFSNITINPGGGHDTVYFYSPISLNSNGAFALNSGILKLNSNKLTLMNSSTNAITRTTGFVISESATNLSSIKWNIPIDFVAHRYPFANSSGTFIPFYFQGTGGTGTYVTVATYAPTTNVISHTPYPPTVTHIRNTAGVNDSAYMVNRFWQIDADTSIGHPTATMYFKYAAAEAPAINNTTALNAQRWNAGNTGWFQPTGSQSWVGGASDSVRTPSVSTFSPWTLAQTGHSLPIELLNFTATYNGLNVDLNWSTASETNNEYFTILRTVNNSDFDFITSVAGAGNTNIFTNYHAVDYKPLTGLSYYQLKQTDFDGHTTLSDLKPITIGNTVFEIKNIYSNHDESTIHVLVNDNVNENITVLLVDVLGNVMVRQKEALTSTASDIKINAANLPLGIYFITVQSDTKVITGKVIY